VTKTKAPANPFYVALVIVGMVFFVTACAYGVMAFRAIRLGPVTAEQNPQPLLVFMAEHGEELMAGELVLLILVTVDAFSTDSYWNRSTQASSRGVHQQSVDDHVTNNPVMPEVAPASVPPAADANEP